MTSELVERAQRGDHEAFDALAVAAYHRLYAIARRILRDGYAAEDAVQDALVRAWRDLRGLRDRDRFDGTERPLVAGPETDSYPVFSDHGDRIALLRADADGGFRLMSANADGSAVTELGQFPTNDGSRWSPDGSALLMNYTTDGDFTGLGLAIVRADGSGVRELDLGMTADWASWRPDGRQIAFRGQPGYGRANAFIADADGTNVRQLAITPSGGGGDLEGLGWSPDGTP